MSDIDTSPKYLRVIAPYSFKHYWKDIWQYRDVFFILAHRDVLVRYKQTVLGLLWAVLKPLLSMAAFTIVFGKIANLPSTEMPYPILVFAGMLPWYFFSNCLSEMGNSVVNSQAMVSKVFFPRLLLPLSTITVGLIDLAISMVLLFIMMIFYGMNFSLTLLALPIFILMAGLACTGLGLWLAALNVRFRDVRIIIPFLLQFGIYISPVGFSSSIIPEKWQLAYSLNPMVGVIDGFRWAISGGATPLYVPGLVMSCSIIMFLLFIGLTYFRSVEKTFADVI